MRKLHRSHTAILGVGLALGFVVLDKFHERQVRRSLSGVFERAKAAEAAGDHARALTYLNIYLTKRPGDVEARALAVDIALGEENLAQPGGKARAVRLIDSLLIVDPKRYDLRLRAARFLLEDPEYYSDAMSHLEVINRAQPNNGAVEYYLGWLEESNGRFAQAADLYERARVHAPAMVEPYDRLARVYRLRLNAPAKGDLIMDLPDPTDGLIHHNPKLGVAYLARAAYRRDFRIGSPAADVAKALELEPNSLDVRITAAREATIEQRYDEARAHLDVAEKLFPGKAQVYLARGSVETRAKNFDGAVEILRRGVAKIPNDIELQWNLADLLVQLGRIPEAEVEIAKLKAAGVKRDLTDFLSAVILVARQRWSEAAPELERLGKILASTAGLDSIARRAYLNMGRCYAELGNTDQQLVAYRRALTAGGAQLDDRLMIEARAGVAAALVDMGQIDEAIEEYRKSLLLPGATEDTKIILARLLIFKNLRMLEAYRRWDEVEQLLDASQAKAADSSEVVILKAETLAAQAKLDPARQLLEKARADHPERPDLWVALAMLAQRQEKPIDAMKVLDDAEKSFEDRKLGERIEIRIARARLLGMQGGPRAAERLKVLGEGIAKFPPVKQRDLVAGIAESFVMIGEVGTALQLWKKMGLEQPNDLVTRLIQFDMALQDFDKEKDEIDRIIGEIRRIEGEQGTLWRYARSRLLIEEFRKTREPGLLVEARDLLDRASHDRPAWSRVPVAQGEIEDLRGNPSLAVRDYQRAIQLGDRSPLAVRRSIQILYQNRRYAAADQILRKLQEQLPISGDMQRLAANISLETLDYARAVSLARKAVSGESRDYRDHMWLGQVLGIVAASGGVPNSAQLLVEAEKSLRRAVELGSDKPDTWVSLIQFMGRTNRAKEGEDLLSQAEAAIPPAEAPFALGQASEAIGKTEKVEELYKKAIELKNDDAVAIQALASYYLRNDRMSDASALLYRLIELRAQSEEESRWARRLLSLIESQGNFRGAVKALEILGLGDEVDEQNGPLRPIDDLRAKVRVLVAQKTLARRNEAKRLLEDVIRRGTPIADDVYQYAKLFELEGNWMRAREQYQRAVTLMRDEPFYVAELARALIRHGQPRDADVWVRKLKSLRADTPDVAELTARLLKAQNQGEAAAEYLLEYVKDKDVRVRVTAELLEELELYDAAEKLFRRHAETAGDPNRPLHLAGFLGRRHRTAEALDICDHAWSTCKPDDVAAVSIQVLYQSDASDEFYARVADQFERIVRVNPNDVALLFELANIRGLQGRIAEAEKIYLDAFRRNPENGAPLNNLAWLLAFQPGRQSEASQYINRAITLHNALPPLLDTRAVVEMASANPEQAIKDLEEAISVEAKPDRQLHLAEAYLLAGRRREAQTAFKDAKSLGLDPGSLHPFDRKPYQNLVDELAKNE